MRWDGGCWAREEEDGRIEERDDGEESGHEAPTATRPASQRHRGLPTARPLCWERQAPAHCL